MARVRRRANGFLRDFKEFALQGNVLDLAIAVIIGAAFGRIVTSFVEDVIMPFINPLVTVISQDWRTITVTQELESVVFSARSLTLSSLPSSYL